MHYSQRQTRYLAATAILLLLSVVDGALFDWRGTAALANVVVHSVEKQAETAEAKVEIYDALWAGVLGVPAKKR
ncbi:MULTISPECIES: hypothetical protein [unclassified Mesorhizobium]|uniref:hypothetical protein n=1 Tax=unclassified Mesorhizobium TaxID=325217 RepID=UPI000FCA90B0|nr:MULTISPECIES: hypothetical protein [unclassified Mesorhizobium]TGP18223.1 hypothetical protein EN874_030340 [Mesorhizobium sp. M1D.F.Ca.ET.231.01.1.1]TGP25461.1 hypothetical protein EN877_29920 [Mesorhizobium sp. M1D.F.Ca.ET.234.01.1.1]TGS38347.1 hypothetical protein EN827_29900 [Mesorhizobium sp. M1D.F.Ca.ET.184.01.1.1]TGS58354.1 hypothetical protein EN826_029875 [Mesorhizobium sp. M1D.F.Ca.ET.183.01.1.1]